MNEREITPKVITGQEYAALQYYIRRLEECVLGGSLVSAGQWFQRIHDLEAKIDQRGEHLEAMKK